MKMKLMMLVVLTAVITGCATTKNGTPIKKTVFIQTNAQCGDCKERIEGVLNFETGIIYSDLNLDNKKVEVKFNTKKTSLAEIKKVISEIGYDADEVKAIEIAQNKLPSCCQPSGHD
jgi:copper chaperone CopZ